MNEITYRPDEEPGCSAILRRQAKTHADFTYSLSGNVISIVDLNLGNRSLTNDIESVLRKIEHYHQGSIVGFNIIAIMRAFGTEFIGMVSMRRSSPCAKSKKDELGRNCLARSK
jgi:hypothetical protein